MTLIEEAIVEAFGERCPETAEGCACCEVWAEYDSLTASEAAREKLEATAIEDYYARQIKWSRETFGPALRTNGVLDHIRKELKEIEADPHDLSEWVDVIILAMDGFWRHGGSAADLMPRLLAKQQKNMARTWPDWRTMSEDQAIEHDRSGETLATLNTSEAHHG
ncbi:dATP/dGTP pyrophosphohydrolase domain-containing protein [Mesorhizobium sp. BE184]|uniref:dATP/dGTP pyrophosphohydrolase domain-containing protein n=1 Tax=Mesorhizobium sp. BE184 TaxID=2817714 RepID=UPI00285E5A0E|nr:dATP/dGTP pyrophosphohydrolase domain-containing protein [Mesorhizobium sp. BE184]MDR7032389.1 hypothetical protein [Mesorhizobium sp. BE184]